MELLISILALRTESKRKGFSKEPKKLKLASLKKKKEKEIKASQIPIPFASLPHTPLFLTFEKSEIISSEKERNKAI